MPILNEFSFPSCDCKNTIYVRQWLPDGQPIGVVQLCHGIAEHISRYDDFAQYLASNGFVVAGIDHLGHGLSVSKPEDLGYFGEHGGWELVVGDMRKLYERLREQYYSLPIFILGHSMGSFLTRTYIIRYHDGPDGAIISGTGQQNALTVNGGLALANLLIRRHGPAYKSQKFNDFAFAGYNSHYKPQHTAFDWLSRNEENVDRYIADPLSGYCASVGVFRDMLTGVKYISNAKNLARMNKDLPVYFISGDEDPVGEYGKGVLRAYNNFLSAGLTDVTLKLYHDDRHEILNELDRETVWSDVLSWLQTKVEAKKEKAPVGEEIPV